MTTRFARNWTPHALVGVLAVVVTIAVAGLPGDAQQKGDWPGITGGYTSTRYAPLDQVNASNFNTLKVAWEWNGSDLPPGVELGDVNARGLPIYVEGLLVTVSGPRRTVVAMDPATGKTVWHFQEPLTPRHEGVSMRSNHGKGVAYTKINASVVIVVTPGFFLHVLDLKTGKPLENWAGPCRSPAFPRPAGIDLLKDVIADWVRGSRRSRSTTRPRG